MRLYNDFTVNKGVLTVDTYRALSEALSEVGYSRVNIEGLKLYIRLLKDKNAKDKIETGKREPELVDAYLELLDNTLQVVMEYYEKRIEIQSRNHIE